MERPSHNIATLQWGSHRKTGLSLAFLMQAVLALVLIGGVVVPVTTNNPVFKLSTLIDKKVPPETPPPPKIVKVDIPNVLPPIVTYDPAPSGTAITTVIPRTNEPPVTPPQQRPVNTVPDRAAVAIAATHSTPPYPTLARRLGAEGKVMLRLSILPDGKVAKAEVVTSSGRRDLDEAAQSWIVGHWTYQPAIKDGAPAAALALAAVQFSLTNP
jgi:protein TonB